MSTLAAAAVTSLALIPMKAPHSTSFGGLSCNTGVSWFASSSESYWVRVFGTNSTGAFPIAVYPTPENDMCEAAIVLDLNETVVGTTLGARLGPEPTVCSADASTAIQRDDLPGAWYIGGWYW